MGAADFQLDLLLEPGGGGATVTFDWTFQPKSLLACVLAPLLRATFERATNDELEGLKRYAKGRV